MRANKIISAELSLTICGARVTVAKKVSEGPVEYIEYRKFEFNSVKSGLDYIESLELSV